MPTSTEAWVVEVKGGPFVHRSLTLDDPLANEVLVRMVASGVCHTDSTVAKGLLPGSSYPVILGHEGAGEVVEVGADVTSVVPGDSVLLSFASCGTCGGCGSQGAYACSDWGMLNFAKIRINGSAEVGTLDDGKRVHGSFFGQSSFGKHALVKESSCVKVPQKTNLARLAPLGCGMLTGAGAVMNVAKPKPDDVVMISGMGGVGMAALFAAVALRVRKIIAVDTFDSRLALATQFGATHTVNALSVDTAEEVLRLTEGEGVNYVIEATGVAPAAKAAFISLASGGTQVQVGDSGVGEMSVPLSLFLQGQRTIIGCLEGSSSPREIIPALVALNEQKLFPLEAISKQYNWRELPQALQDVHGGAVIKPILVFS